MNNFQPGWENDFYKQFNSVKRLVIVGWLFGAVVVASVVGTGLYLLLKHFG